MLDEWIEQLRKGNCIAERDLKKLCVQVRRTLQSIPTKLTFVCNNQVKNLLMEESNVQFVKAPVTVRIMALLDF